MDDFDLSRYLALARPDGERSPVETVLEYVSAFQKWSRDCNCWVKQNRDDKRTLWTGAPRRVFDEIQKKYCTSRNRQDRQHGGYYYYSGTNDVWPSIASFEQLDTRTCLVVTEKRKPRYSSFRFTLQKQGRVWLIANLERLDGVGLWVHAAL